MKTLSKLIATWRVCVIMRTYITFYLSFVTRCLHAKKAYPKLPSYDDPISLFLLTLLEEKSSITTSVFISSNFSFSIHKVARIYCFFHFLFSLITFFRRHVTKQLQKNSQYREQKHLNMGIWLDVELSM